MSTSTIEHEPHDSLETLSTLVISENTALLGPKDTEEETETFISRLRVVLNEMFEFLASLLGFRKSKATFVKKNVEEDKLKIFIGTWNMHGRLPPRNKLAPFVEKPIINLEDTQHAPLLSRKSQHPYHLLVIGTQECQHNIKHSIFFPSKEEWESRLIDYLGDEYVLVKTETMAALHLAVFVWRQCKDFVKDYQHDGVATGLANLFGNKGGIGISLLFGNTSLCFINSHLAAHQDKVQERNNDVKKISKEMKLKGFKPEDEAYVNVTDRFDYTFWFGDMNYRVEFTREEADEHIKKEDISALLLRDQLSHQLTGFPYFSKFKEGKIEFYPTFKFDITHRSSRSSLTESKPEPTNASYDSGPKQRVPSWTDRIIFKTRLPQDSHVSKVEVERYGSHTNVIGFSDHRPVTGVFLVKFDWKLERERVNTEIRERMRHVDYDGVKIKQRGIVGKTKDLIKGKIKKKERGLQLHMR
ncbi:10268_t:CDS:2 [Acaulospora morrowiae]|uniref:10268_t:CDS:1 n=1 Tax=Acaulospora morrowiae TaxID=94023 RepID=A0A9N9FWJ5_9GLOM|nr:10268_t:CDS:2 [Acaulospora morrowiae]